MTGSKTKPELGKEPLTSPAVGEDGWCLGVSLPGPREESVSVVAARRWRGRGGRGARPRRRPFVLAATRIGPVMGECQAAVEGRVWFSFGRPWSACARDGSRAGREGEGKEEMAAAGW